MSLREGDAPATPAGSNRSAAKAWLRALELTAPIVNNPRRIFSTVIDKLAEKFGEAPALLSDRERLTYRALAERSNRYARWALDQSVRKGEDRKSTRLNSSHTVISYAVFCLKKKNITK